MNYYNKEYNFIQSTPVPGLLEFPDEFMSEFYKDGKRAAGFVDITDDGQRVNSCVWNEEAYQKWCDENPAPDALEDAKAAKEAELSAACNVAIENGLDIQLGDKTEHFNYSEKDQLNIKEMFDAVRMGATEYPYQSDTGECRVYSAAEIALIYQTLAGHKTGNLTYYHQLKSYVGTLDTADEVAAVFYGQALTGDYLAHYTDMMAVVQAQMAAVLSAG